MALIITPNYEVTPIEPENGKLTLEQLQSIVEGYIEIVHIGEKELMVVNEEGLLRNMEVNDVATTYLNIRKLYVGENPVTTPIVGVALFCGNGEID